MATPVHSQKLDQNEFTLFKDQIAAFPGQLRTVTAEIPPTHLGSSYRPGGWTAAQIVNHLADSHLNFYLRLKLALTQDNPTVCAYDQDVWAALPDGIGPHIDHSLQILEGLHRRIVPCLECLTELDRARTFYHPEYKETRTIDHLVSTYAWHGLHHLAQLKQIIPAPEQPSLG